MSRRSRVLMRTGVDLLGWFSPSRRTDIPCVFNLLALGEGLWSSASPGQLLLAEPLLSPSPHLVLRKRAGSGQGRRGGREGGSRRSEPLTRTGSLTTLPPRRGSGPGPIGAERGSLPWRQQPPALSVQTRASHPPQLQESHKDPQQQLRLDNRRSISAGNRGMTASRCSSRWGGVENHGPR